MNLKLNALFALGLTLAGMASAQDSTKAPLTTDEKISNTQAALDGLNESYLETKGTVDKLAKIKVGGYIQVQYQHAEEDSTSIANKGVGAFAGGAFGTTNQRIQLRRVRLKTAYDGGTSQYVMEFEARPSGVALKDAEVILKEPWLKTFTLAGGLMDRPFGFEIPYSSSAHEAPERTRVYQTVFKDEKDLGVKLEINPAENMGFAQFLNLKGGVYTGTSGYGGGTGDEIDSTVDIIGRLGFKAPLPDLALAIDGGVSYYAGKSLSLNDSVFTMSGTALNATTGNLNKTFDRNVLGVDLQVYYTIPVVGDILGGTSLRGEYLSGKTPGTLGNSQPYGATQGYDVSKTPKVGNYMAERKFMGYYVSWIQNLGSMFQTVVKYDVYDPNTDVKGSDVGVAANGKLSANDLQYSTLGLGLLYYWDSSVKLTAYYDMVTNEKASTGAFAKDLKDNILTLRAQVKF